MGSMISRHLRDLSEVAGCEAVSDTMPPLAPVGPPSPTSSRPCTPAPVHKTKQFNLDPRSPSAEIVRTPIEVRGNSSVLDSPMTAVLADGRSYLETDLDSLSTQTFSSKPNVSMEGVETPKQDSKLPAGLSKAHLMKLRFLGLDPRSPSAEIVRTPIQVKEKLSVSANLDDTLSLGSLSIQDILSNSDVSHDLTREFSDPSAFISDIDEGDLSVVEGSDSNAELQKKETVMDAGENVCVEKDCEATVTAPSSEAIPKSKLMVFCEEETQSPPVSCKLSGPDTPDVSNKHARGSTRTPLTPLCNRNMTPNSIIRSKQTQVIQKEKLAKVKIYDDNMMTPSKQILSVRKSTKNSGARNSPAKSSKKGVLTNSENTPVATVKASVHAQWDHDTSIII